MRVIKRDKTKELFQFQKIENAIKKAFDSVNAAGFEDVIDCMRSKYDEKTDKDVDVEDIQNSIERCLMYSHPDVAKSFIIYRYRHKVLRDEQSALEKDINKKLAATNVENQNANVDEKSFGGRMGEACRVVTKNDALKRMSRKSRRNHLNNEIYIHDLDSYSVGEHNCLTIPFDDLLSKGFKLRQTDVRPARSINTAFQHVAVLFQVQSLQQFGGVSASHLDWTMVPYVRISFYKHYKTGLKYIMEDVSLCDAYDEKMSIDDDEYKKYPKVYDYAMEMTTNELRQSVEAMYHNLNTLQSRSGNQLPFSSINYGTCTLTEGRMVTKALLEGSIAGTGKFHKTPIFPCGIFQAMKGVNRKEGEPNYDLFKLALKSTSQRLYPNYVNVDWSNNAGYDINDPRTYMSTMGCHAKDTMIIMFDGSLKAVQDIEVGDQVMGLDGKDRTVVELIRGKGKMFKVDQSDANSYIVNEGHILSLMYAGDEPFEGHVKGDVINISVYDYVSLPDTDTKKMLKGYRYVGGEPMISNITITQVEDDNFYGFDIDGDKLYMMEDGTVTHNCRTVNGYDINGFGQLKDGRGNICPVTIIMPTLAMEANRDVESFMKLLDKKIFEAKDMLLERFEWICSQSPESARFMWDNDVMKGYIPEEGIRSAMKHGTIVIGQLGLAETLQLLIGTDQTTDKGMELAKRIEGMFSKRCKEFKEEYHLNFGVYYTPAENLCYTAMKKFKAKYGVIENVSDKEFFTNSMHVPVWKKISPFEKIDIESQLTGYSNAGCITYVELPSTTKHNIDALETIVNYAMDHDIPYFAINVPNDTCNDCGYTDEINDCCPMCGGHNISRLRRVTGYLTGDYKTAFNEGKQDEVKNRVKHERII